MIKENLSANFSIRPYAFAANDQRSEIFVCNGFRFPYIYPNHVSFLKIVPKSVRSEEVCSRKNDSAEHAPLHSMQRPSHVPP